MEYLFITEQNILQTIFSCEKKKDRMILQYGRANPISIQLPLVLDENMAKIPAMLLDGSLNKDLSAVMFSQKKDLTKIEEFSDIIKNIFQLEPRLKKRINGDVITYSNKTFCYFLHYVLDINKSDQHTKIPFWIWKSPKTVKKEYLRYGFAMEGSVRDPRIGDKEVRFHSCDFNHTIKLRNFILQGFDIDFKLKKYFIKNYGWKYYLYISDNYNIKKFSDNIGFALDLHQRRLIMAINLFKSKSWEITLAEIIKQGKETFSSTEIKKLFPHLKSRRSIHERLSQLVKKGYLFYDSSSRFYSLTQKSYFFNQNVPFIKNVPLRTSPKENEQRILRYLSKNGKSWRNQIARSLNINCITVRDVLRRLEQQDKVVFINKDKFQRKFVKIINI